MKTKQRAQVPFGLKKKLMAATSMLLVAAIMLVSTSYAWFTLSTAPEITGITTSVGANGNLEIALLNGLTYQDTSLITSNTGDSMATQDVTAANVTWGNLVDLSSNYGLESLTIYPSALNLVDAKVGLAPLSVPEYGADGRVSQLSANTTTGVYDATNAVFSAESGIDEYGVRAVGTADNMSARQITFKSAVSTFNSKYANAKSATRTAIGGNYSVFISMASGSTDYTYKQISAMKTIAVGAQTSLNNIVSAYANAGLAKAAADTSIDDTIVATLSTALSTATNANSLKSSLNTAGITAYDTELTALAEHQANVAEAIGAADALLALGSEEYTYDDKAFSYPAENPTYTGTETDAVTKLIATPLLGSSSNIVAYGEGGTEVAIDPDAVLTIRELYLNGGAVGAVAEYAGAFKAADVFVDGLVDLSINVGTKGVTDGKLKTVSTMVGALSAPGDTSTTTNITTAYGYIIDFAVRTNAADSKLLLQTEAANRVYSDATGDELATMGSGSTVTFTYEAGSGMTAANAQRLLEAFCVVFFEPSEGTVLKYAKFTNINAGATSATADLKLFDVDTETAAKYMLGKDAFTVEYMLNTVQYPAATETTQYTNYPTDTTVALTAAQYEALAATTTNTSATTGTGDSAVTVITYTLGKNAYVPQYKIDPEFKVSVTTGTGESATTTQVAPAASDCWNYPTEALTALEYKYLEDTTASVTKSTVTYEEAATTEIMALTQNQAHKLSVLVYMDGEGIDNSAVAATALASGSMKMNIQFASDATLKPMENSALKNMESTSGN